MKKIVLSIALLAATGFIYAQKKTTTSGVINFDATTSLDALPKAENKTVIIAVDPNSGSIAFEVIMKNFTFGNPRMQEHFNGPKWLDSEKFPLTTFKGNITNLASINFNKDGVYNADVEGNLTMHGITQPIKTTGKIGVAGNVITTNADFSVKLADYEIDGPQIGAGKISKEPKISVSASLQ